MAAREQPLIGPIVGYAIDVEDIISTLITWMVHWSQSPITQL